ncbi:MAG TPA: hypothetical protein EYG71_04015 [Leucothrix sp.]|nr:hypothetical protein [Leucothrix sp.]
MARLVISFYLTLLLSIAVFVIGVTGSFAFIMPEPLKNNINLKLAKGTLALLSDEFTGVDKNAGKKLLNEYRQYFGQDLILKEQTSFKYLSKQQHDLLDAGDVVFEIIDNPIFIKKDKPEEDEDLSEWFYYFKKPNSSKVWRVHFDLDKNGTISFPESSNDDGIPELNRSHFFTGMMFLIQSRLFNNNALTQTLPQKLEKTQSLLGFPINVVKANSLSILGFEQIDKVHPLAGRAKQSIYVYTEANDDISIVQRLSYDKNSANMALKVGPFERSWFMKNTSMLMILALVLGLLTSFIIWLWPLWSNLIKIKNAAAEFGKGNYSARISSGKLSPIKTISNAFNAMAEKTEDSIRSQKELTSAVSHELRTPIARMKFALEALESSQDEKEKSASIIDIKEDIAELNGLVDELLMYVRYDQKNATLNLAEVYLVPWFNASLERLQPLAIDKKLNYRAEKISADETCKIDPRLMTRVIDNLVQNALRYATQDVSVKLIRTQSGYLLSVEDDGEGIPEDQKKIVFEAFSRIDNSRNRRTGGYGLGLAIVDKIIKAHKGSIVISEPHYLCGARFEVRFPD